MAVAPFAAGTPIMANYVPVIESPAFLGGLALFGAGFALVVARLVRGWFRRQRRGPLVVVAGRVRRADEGGVVRTERGLHVALLPFVAASLAAFAAMSTVTCSPLGVRSNE